MLNNNIMQHYTRQDLGDVILAALGKAGKDVDNLKPEDLAPIDEFHVRGRKATLELAHDASLGPDMHVLDVGSGIGGPSRCIAQKYGCRVTGIDLIEEYCRVAQMLALRIGLSNLVTFRQADACALPFPDAAFDVVWTQHSAINISDKTTLYREMFRVLKNGGTLAIYDILAGPVSPIHFPVPWACRPEESHLVTTEELRPLLEKSGFSIESWKDTTDVALAWFTNVSKKIQQSGLTPLGIHVLLGADFKVMAQNQRKNLEEGRIVLAQIVARKCCTN
jgi:ubiquinone/menaquinone biosynthesis C-methylase UbiE